MCAPCAYPADKKPYVLTALIWQNWICQPPNYQQRKGICLVNSLISWWILYSGRSISNQTVASCLEFHHILSPVLSANSCPINLTVHTYWLLMIVGLCAWEGARFTLERLCWYNSASTTCQQAAYYRNVLYSSKIILWQHALFQTSKGKCCILVKVHARSLE